MQVLGQKWMCVQIPVPGATSLLGYMAGTYVSCGEGAGASDMRHAQTVQTVSYRLTEHTCACVIGLDAVSAMLMESCILLVRGEGWQQETSHYSQKQSLRHQLISFAHLRTGGEQPHENCLSTCSGNSYNDLSLC